MSKYPNSFYLVTVLATIFTPLLFPNSSSIIARINFSVHASAINPTAAANRCLMAPLTLIAFHSQGSNHDQREGEIIYITGSVKSNGHCLSETLVQHYCGHALSLSRSCTSIPSFPFLPYSALWETATIRSQFSMPILCELQIFTNVT